jgi:hypothetical protein
LGLFHNHGSHESLFSAIPEGEIDLYRSFPFGCKENTSINELNDAVGLDAYSSGDPAPLNGVQQSHAIGRHAVTATTLREESTAAVHPATVSQDYYAQVTEDPDAFDGPPNLDYSGAIYAAPSVFNAQDLANNVAIMLESAAPAELISCVYNGCTKTFTRTADLDRHVLNVHNRIGHNCQVPDCSNNKGKGYCRADKLKEHMWKKHKLVADLSYTKAKPSPFDLFQ